MKADMDEIKKEIQKYSFYRVKVRIELIKITCSYNPKLTYELNIVHDTDGMMCSGNTRIDLGEETYNDLKKVFDFINIPKGE